MKWIPLVIGLMMMTSQTNATSDDCNSTIETPAIQAVLEDYWKAADRQNADQLNRVFHDDYRVVALTSDGSRLMLKSDYLTLIKAKKIGGEPRKFKLISTDVSGDVAQSRLTLRSEAVTFFDHITLTKTSEGWKLISNVTQVTPN